MIRAPWGHQKYWNKWIQYGSSRLKKEWKLIQQPSLNPSYDPQYTFDTGLNIFRVLVSHYSRGDNINELSQHFAGLLDAWELSNKLSDEICAKENIKTCRDWIFELSNLNHYIWCFWLVGLALLLDIPDEQWQRLLQLIGGEGEDVLLDRVIASRQPNWKIGNTLLHPKPYARLLKAIDAEKEAQPALLKEFVGNWYTELNRKGEQQPYWYIYGDPEKHPLEMGSYFGRWCIEAAVATKAFNLDDALCLGHDNYPGDLLRPDGETTHPQRIEETTTKQKNSLWRLLFRLFK